MRRTDHDAAMRGFADISRKQMPLRVVANAALLQKEPVICDGYLVQGGTAIAGGIST